MYVHRNKDSTAPKNFTNRISYAFSFGSKWPGTAFTRSIGDSLAKELGVIAEPECEDFLIPSAGATFVLGSDGVFDFIPNDEIGAAVKKYEDAADACRELVGKAFNRWCNSEGRTDDITIIVGHVHVAKCSSAGRKIENVKRATNKMKMILKRWESKK